MIIVQRVNQRPKRREVVGAEQRSTRRHSLEVLDQPPVGPRRRQTPQRLGIHLARTTGTQLTVKSE